MLVAGSAAAATAPDLVTSTTAGPPTNEPQPQASLSSSADGTRIAFVSSAADLVPGDVVEMTVEGIGTIRNVVVAGPDLPPVRAARARPRHRKRA